MSKTIKTSKQIETYCDPSHLGLVVEITSWPHGGMRITRFHGPLQTMTDDEAMNPGYALKTGLMHLAQAVWSARRSYLYEGAGEQGAWDAGAETMTKARAWNALLLELICDHYSDATGVTRPMVLRWLSQVWAAGHDAAAMGDHEALAAITEMVESFCAELGYSAKLCSWR